MNPTDATRETKNCPYCGEEILATAIKCKHCKSDLSPSPAAGAKPERTGINRKLVAVTTALVALLFLVITNPSDLPQLEKIGEGSDAAALAPSVERINRGIFSIFHVDWSATREKLSRQRQQVGWFTGIPLGRQLDGGLDLLARTVELAPNRMLGVAGMYFDITDYPDDHDAKLAALEADAKRLEEALASGGEVNLEASPTERPSPPKNLYEEQGIDPKDVCRAPPQLSKDNALHWFLKNPREHVGPHGKFGVYEIEGGYRDIDVACFNQSHVAFDHGKLSFSRDGEPFEPQTVALRKVFELHSFELFGWRFGQKTVYLVDTLQGGQIDGTATNSCFFVTVSGKDAFKVSFNIECPIGANDRIGDEASKHFDDFRAFQIDGDVIRYKVKNPKGYADADDIGEFALDDNVIKTIKPYKSDEYYRQKFASLTPDAILEEIRTEGAWRPGDTAISDHFTAIRKRQRSCFKYAATSIRSNGMAEMLLEDYCKGWDGKEREVVEKQSHLSAGEPQV